MSLGLLALSTLGWVLGAETTQPNTASALAGEWVLAGAAGSGRLTVSSDGATVDVSLQTRGEELQEHYRVSGAQGTALVLEVAQPLPSPEAASSPWERRARILPLSPGVALWWRPHRLALFAYRKRPLPQSFHGRYSLDKSSSNIRAVEVKAESIVRWEDDRGDDEGGDDDGSHELAILAVTDEAAGSVRIVLDGPAPREVLRIQLQGDRATLVREIDSEPDEELHARFLPAGKRVAAGARETPSKAVAKGQPLPLGQFRLSALGRNEEAFLRVSASDVTVLPLSGARGTSLPTRTSATLSPGALRVDLGLTRRTQDAFTLRRIDHDISLIEYGNNIFVAYREDDPPPWAPAVGLAEDARLLCRELDAVKTPSPGQPLDEGSVKAALERACSGARSDVMHSIVEAVSAAPFNEGVLLLEQGLRDAGEPAPACPGLHRLHQVALQLGH